MLRDSPKPQPRAGPDRGVAARLQRRRRSFATASPACARPPTSSARRCASSPRRRPSATTARCSPATSPASSRQGTAWASGSGSRSSSRRTGPTTRAASPRRRPTAAATSRNFLHYNPYPNTASPGQPRECEAGNEAFLGGQQVIGNVPGNQGTVDRRAARAATKRERERVRRPLRHPRGDGPRPEQAGARRARLGPQLPRPGAVGLRPADRACCSRSASTSRSRSSCRSASPGYELTATFENAATLRETSPVRIAGVNVGEVTGVEADGERGQGHLHRRRGGPADPRATPRSRSARGCSSRATSSSTSSRAARARPSSTASDIPVTQTATAVQLDEVLTALQAPERRGLQRLLEGYGTALTYEPTAADDVDQDPIVARRDGGRVAQRRLPLRRRRRPRHGDRQHGAARREPARPRRVHPRLRRDLRQARRPRGRALGPDHQLQRLHRRARGRVGEPLA